MVKAAWRTGFVNFYQPISIYFLSLLAAVFNHKLRLSYSKIEECVSVDEIRHPSAREVLRYLEIFDCVEIHYDGDMPSKSGVGSSSAFTVGMQNAIHAYKDEMVSADRLAKEAIHIEQQILGEVVGSQDQVSTAHGISRWHSTSSYENLDNIQSSVEIYECNLNNLSSVDRVIDQVRPDVIIHLASHANVRASFDIPVGVLSNIYCYLVRNRTYEIADDVINDLRNDEKKIVG